MYTKVHILSNVHCTLDNLGTLFPCSKIVMGMSTVTEVLEQFKFEPNLTVKFWSSEHSQGLCVRHSLQNCNI